MRQATRIDTAVAILLTVTVAGAGAVTAEPPPQSGAVERFEDPGFSSVRAETAVDGEVRDVIAVFNFESVADICAQNLAQAASVQIVDPDEFGPAAFHQSVTDDDVPVLLFDVTGLGLPPDSIEAFVLLVCVEQSLGAFASGSADIRLQLNVNDAQFSVVDLFSAHGTVSDGDSEWRLQARSTTQFSSKTDVERVRQTIRLR